MDTGTKELKESGMHILIGKDEGIGRPATLRAGRGDLTLG